MSYDQHIAMARTALRQAKQTLTDEIRDYPTPISGCDAQFNHLVGLRGSIDDALASLHAPRFVATPRAPDPDARVESR